MWTGEVLVGWSLSERMTADIAVAALESAKSRGYVAGNAIFHSDRGTQYTSRTLAEWARANDVRLSCSRTGNCHDNAVAESFFATLKNEFFYHRDWDGVSVESFMGCWTGIPASTTSAARSSRSAG